jgi:flagellar M-ring protein FliF
MDQWKKLISSLSTRQRLVIVATAAGVIVALLAFSRWRQDSNFAPLFTRMSADDAAAVVQKLKESGTEYRIKEGDGTTILIPTETLAETRLNMAGAGLPRTGRVGFELFDKTNLGATEFAEHINYARAVEGELERSIRCLREVEQARVHLTFPKESVFVDSRQPAKASVLLQLKPGAKLSSQNVVAICHLVASAVEGLTPGAVSVVDSRGVLLSKPRPTGPEGEMPEAVAEYREKLERDMLAKIQFTLEPLLGSERFRASVAVDCDLTSGEEREETYDPEQTVILTSTKTEESSGSGNAGGVPGTASSLPRPLKSASSGASTLRRSETVGYQPSKTVRQTRIPQGIVKRVSVALLLDHTVQWENQGGKQVRKLNPVPPETLQSVRDIVSAVIGLSAERGDQLVVESLAFDATLRADPLPSNPAAQPPTPAAGGWGSNVPLDVRDKRLWAVAAAALLLMALLGFGLKKLLRRSGVKQPNVSLQTELPPAADDSSGESPADGYKKQLESQAEQKRKLLVEAQEKLKTPVQTEKGEVLVGHLRESVKKDPANAASAIRQLLQE